MDTADKSVIKPLGFCGSGATSDPARVDVLDGKVVRIRPLHYSEQYTREGLNFYEIKKGDKTFDQGFKSLLSPMALAYKKRTYSKNRILYPLKRVDWDPDGERNAATRGSSKFERISWDEALDIIAKEIVRVRKEYGNAAILCQGDGHGEDKNIQGAHGCHTSMFYLIGGSTVQARQPDSWEGWYWGASHVWGMAPMGQQTSQREVFLDITQNGDAVLFWGCDPETTPLGWGGQLPSRMCYWFNEIGVKSIHIAPDVNYSNGIHADKWIPVLPNTDAALQLAIAYVWITENTFDREYLDSHSIGFDWFEHYVLGDYDGTPKTPEWASEKCGVPDWEIKALARYWARHRVSIGHCNGGGYIRSAFSSEPGRLEVCLLAMQGLGKPGANQIKFIEWNFLSMTEYNPLPISEKYPFLMAAYHGWDMHVDNTSFIPKTLIAKALMLEPGEKLSWYGHSICLYPPKDQFLPFQFPREGEEYGIHMVWSDSPCWSTCWNCGNDLEDALRRDAIEFVLVQHPWFENDCLFADIILPVCTIMECADIGGDTTNGQVGLMYYTAEAIEKMGESLTDYEVVGRVAKKLEEYGGEYEGLYDRYTDGKTIEEWMQVSFEASGYADYADYDEFLEKEFIASPISDEWKTGPHGMFNFWKDPENHRLETPSGKIQFYAPELAEHFPDDDIRGPYPKWIEETEDLQERISCERAKEYPFLLVSNHPRYRVHAQHDDSVWLREIGTQKIVGPDGYKYEAIWINPVDAEKYGIEHGDIVGIFNERGTVLGGAYITERIMPGALYQDHGAHIDPIVVGIGGIDRGGANNLICPSTVASPNTVAEVTNGFLVGLKKVDVFELAKQYPEQFGRAYDHGCGLIPDSYMA